MVETIVGLAAGATIADAVGTILFDDSDAFARSDEEIKKEKEKEHEYWCRHPYGSLTS